MYSIKLPLLALLFPWMLQAQSYQYSCTIKDVKKPEMVYFGYWYTGAPYFLDSVKVDSVQPVAQFKGKKNLETGLYFFYHNGQKTLLEFIVNNEFDLRFTTSMLALADSFSVEKSVENEPYFYWRTFKRSRETRIETARSMLDMLRKATRDREVLEEQAKTIRTLRAEIDANTRKQLTKYPNLFFPKLVNSELPATVPATIETLLADGSLNPEYMQYFRDHFWDNYDFTDTRLLRSPALARKTDDWMQIQGAVLDSVKSSLSFAIKKASVQQESKNKLLQLMLERFDKPSYGGNETMLVYLFDQFMPTAKSAGIDTAAWMRMEYKANSYRGTLPGRIAPEIKLKDTTGAEISLYNFKAKYTLLYFFSPLCAHCKEATPGIYAMTLPYADKGIRVFAVTTDGRFDYWKNYVATNTPQWTCVADENEPSTVEKMYATHNLPNLLILDNEKKILVRRLPLSDLPKILEGLSKE